MIKQWSLVLMLALALVGQEAEAARRLGGGQSVGTQSSNVTQRQAAPATPAAPGSPAAAPNATPAANPAAAAAPARPATPAAAAPAKRPWGAMLGGLAAGLGLAWLAHSLGFGEAFGQMLMFGLLAMVIMGVVGFVLSKRRSASQAAAGGNNSPFAFQGAGNAPASAPVLRQYSPDNVGNDASARPWERQSQFDAPASSADASTRPHAGGVQIGSALAGASTWAIPADFDTVGFLDAAKRNFVTLQGAWDRSDLDTLRSMMTDGMLDEIRVQLTEREAHRSGGQNTTDVVMLEAQLLGIEDLGEGYMASVEFSGMIREEPSAGPNPFREVWNMTKPKDGRSGWLVAGVQALQ